MADLSKKSVMVVAHGLYCEFAVALAREFGKVYFCPYNVSDYPKIEKTLCGTGMEGITVVPNPFVFPFDKIDLWCFPGIGHSDLQMRLREMGATIFGTGKGDEIEISRSYTQEYMRRIGLPTNAFDRVHTIDGLREYLKKHPDVFIKMEEWRGNFESMYAKDLETVENELDRLALDMGPFKYLVDFTCEKPLKDKAEVGLDTLCVDGSYPESTFGGYEIKDCGFVGMYRKWTEFPAEVRLPFEAMVPLFKKYKYRSFLSSESRIGKDKKPFTIDWTNRLPSPPNEIFIEMDTALPQRVWAAAHGEVVNPNPIAKYGACAMIRSGEDDIIKHHCIQFPPKYRKNVKIHYPVKIEGKYYACTNGIIGSVIGWGSTMKAACDMVKEVAGEVSGHKTIINVESLDKAESEIEKADKYGIRMFPKG